MAAPTYACDLSDFNLAEVVDAWAESTDALWDDGGSPAQEGDYYIQGSKCISATTSVSKGNYSSIIANYGSGITVPTDGAVLVWQYFAAPNALDSEANGGQVVAVGSGLGDFYYWITGGNDSYPNPYGGWKNVAVDPAQSVDGTVGSPTSTKQYVGCGIKNTQAISKGNPFGVDAIRFGRCESRFTDGDSSNGYCTFAGFAAVNDNNSYRWGLIQAISGGYLWKGLITVGYSSVAEFVDSDVSITIDNTKKVSANFNKIEVRQESTKLYWTRVSFLALGTVSKGRFEMIDNADVQLTSCQFTGMDTFVLLSNAQILSSTFLRCGQITAPGCTMTGSQVLLSTVAANASAVVWNVATDPDGYLDNMTFSKGANAHHAIELGTSSPTEVTLRGWTSTGFSATNEQNDSTIYVARSSGTVTINIAGGTGNFSYKSAGATVSVVTSSVTTTLTIKDIVTDTIIVGAQVLLEAADAAGDLNYRESVTSIVRSDSTATVTHTAHGLATNDLVHISGASEWQYNGVHQITVSDVDTYTYTVTGTPDSPAGGTIVSTEVIFHEDTDENGQVSDTRPFTLDQKVSGRVRKHDTSPLYKTQPISGEIDTSSGWSATILMIRDE